MPSTRSRHHHSGYQARRTTKQRRRWLAAFNWYMFGVAVGIFGLGRLGLVAQDWLWVPVLSIGTATWLHVRRSRRHRSRVQPRVVAARPPTTTARRPAPVPAARSRHIPNHVKIAAALASNGRCAHCGANEDLAFDHVIPYNRGGSSLDASNIQILCRPCNSRKRDRYIG